jgi:hypothetical protein
MKSLLNLRVLASLAAAASLVSGIVVGCGGSSETPGGNTDGGLDATQPEPDAPADQVSPPGTDGGPGDGGPDAPIGDADAGDTGPSTDAAPLTLTTYPVAQATAFCKRMASCCPADAGTIDVGHCVDFNSTYGWEFSLPESLSYLDGGHIEIDPDAAADCVNRIGHATCSTPITPTEYAAISKACFRALRGNIPAGQGPCLSGFECAPGTFCAPTADAGTKCRPLLDAGEPCAPIIGDQACSYLGNGDKGYCNRIDAPDGSATCATPRPDGTLCTSDYNYYDDEACGSLLCGDDWNCGSAQTFPTQIQCDFYAVKADAGGVDGGDAGDGGDGG